MSHVIKIAAVVGTIALLGLIGTASVRGWGVSHPAKTPADQRPKAYHPSSGFFLIYHGTRGLGRGRGGGASSGSFRGGK